MGRAEVNKQLKLNSLMDTAAHQDLHCGHRGAGWRGQGDVLPLF